MTQAVGAGRPAEMTRRIGFKRLGVQEGEAQENRRARFAQLISIAQAQIDLLGEQVRGSGYALLLIDGLGGLLYERVDSSTPGVPRERMGPGVAIRGPEEEVIAVLDAACAPASAASR